MLDEKAQVNRKNCFRLVSLVDLNELYLIVSLALRHELEVLIMSNLIKIRKCFVSKFIDIHCNLYIFLMKEKLRTTQWFSVAHSPAENV